MRMELSGFRFSNFQDALPVEHLSRAPSADRWELVDYTSTHGDGTMLLCRGKATPPAKSANRYAYP